MTFQMSDLVILAPHMVLVGTALLVLMVEAFGHGERRDSGAAEHAVSRW